METKKSGVAIGNILGILLLIFAALITIDSIWRTSVPMLKVTNVMVLLSLVSACVYFIFGAKKNAAPYYKGFLIMFAISEFTRITLVQAGDELFSDASGTIAGDLSKAGGGLVVEMMVDVLLFAILCVLALATDLGKKKSMILGCLALVLSLVVNIAGLIPMVMSGQSAVALLMMASNTGTRLILCVALLLMIRGKYKDKAERDTK